MRKVADFTFNTGLKDAQVKFIDNSSIILYNKTEGMKKTSILEKQVSSFEEKSFAEIFAK